MTARFDYRGSCEVCGSDVHETLMSEAFTDPKVWEFLTEYYEGRVEQQLLAAGRYEILRCERCGFIWQAQILNPESMHDLYTRWISSSASLQKKQCADADLPARYAAEVEVIADLVDKQPHAIRVLDFGMGWGHWCLMAKAFGYEVAGLELAPDRIEFARQREIDTFSHLEALPSHSFDFINCEQVFEHIPNPRQTLARLRDALAPRGVIRISVPNGRKMVHDLRRPDWRASKNALQPLEHINCYTHRTLARLGKQEGLGLMSQPMLVVGRKHLRALAVGLIANCYNRWIGTSLYFRCKADQPGGHRPGPGPALPSA